MTCDPATVARLEELLAAIRKYDDPRRASQEWKQAHRVLEKTDLPPARVSHVVAMRDAAALAGLIEQFREPAPAPAGDASPGEGAAASAAQEAPVPDAETCRRALKAFRKRLALTMLDEESQGNPHNPLSKGTDRHAIRAITLPPEWPDAVWGELARQGKILNIGHGLYELVKPPDKKAAGGE